MSDGLTNISATDWATHIGTGLGLIMYVASSITGATGTEMDIIVVLSLAGVLLMMRKNRKRADTIINNLFVNAFEPLDIKKGQAKTTQVYDYRNCNPPFVGREDAKQALYKFMAPSEEHFLWYVVYGEAGAGKSRLAFELCKEYSEDKKWDCGFIYWDEFSVEKQVLENWKPKRPTLIVIDDATKYIRSDINYVNENQKVRQGGAEFLDLASALGILKRRAKTFKKPVRFLLLARGQKQEVATSSETAKLFHEQFIKIGTNEKLHDDLRSSYYSAKEDEPHFFLEGLEDDELWELAKSVIGQQWPEDCSTMEQFIKRLETDDPQKRPLFAIMIADRLNTSDKNKDTLQEVIESIFNSAKCPGLCRDDVYLLVLATMCGGLQSFPETEVAPGISFPLPNVWDPSRTDIRAKYQRWGIINTMTEHGIEVDHFLPVKPDLVGEFFALGGFKDVCATFPDNNTSPLNATQNLAFIAWHHVLENEGTLKKMEDFFSRCGDDFPNEGLKDVVASLLPRFVKKYEGDSNATLRQKSYLSWGGIVVNLISSYGRVKELGFAENLFDAMADLGDHQDIVMQRGRVFLHLLMAYCSADNIEEAENLFKIVADLGNPQYNAFLRAHASSALIGAYIRAGDLKNAEKVFEDIADLPNRDDQYGINTERARVANELIEDYTIAGDLGKIEKIIKTIGCMDDLPDHTVLRTRAYEHLIDAYGEAGDLKKAKKKYNAMTGLVCDMGHQKYVVLHDRAKASLKLIHYYIQAGTFDDMAEAQNIYDDMIKLDDQVGIAKREYIGVTNLCAWAAIHLQYAYVTDDTPDNIKQIRKIYENMASNTYFMELMFPIEPGEPVGTAKWFARTAMDMQFFGIKYYTPDNKEKLKKIYETWASNRKTDPDTQDQDEPKKHE